MSGGGGGGDTTTIQKADPWAGQQPYLSDIFSEASRLYRTAQPTYYPGNTVAPFSDLELLGQTQALGTALGPMTELASSAGGANQFLLGDVLRADSNPYMAGYAEGAIRPVFDTLSRRTLPGITSGAAAAGQLGGSRQGIAEGLAISDATRQALDTTSQIYSDAYGQNLDALTKGLALAPATSAQLLQPAETIAGVGAQQRSMEQALIDAAMQKYAFEQGIPWDSLAAYQGLVQGTYGGTGTSTVSGAEPSTGQQLAGAAGAGIATYGALSSIPALAPVAPWAAGAMALLSLF